MRILLYTDKEIERTKFVLDYIRRVNPNFLPDIVLVDLTDSDEVRAWGGNLKDLTYVYVEERITTGKAFNQIIEGLKIDDDILITDNCHIPLISAYERLMGGFTDNTNSFAVGPLSNSFLWDQHMDWKNYEDAINWSEKKETDQHYEEVLFLYSGVIALKKSVINGKNTFSDEAVDIDNMIIEKCIREFCSHGRMYVCNSSGFWDIRGSDYSYTIQANVSFLEKSFGIHYLNVRGNDGIVKLISDYKKEKNENIKILEIGCDCGGTLFRLHKLFPKAELYGTDINADALKITSEFAEVKMDNIEECTLDFGVKDFDIIIFADVLEHLRNPLNVLVFCKKILKKNGIVAASIPNLMNIEVVKQLLNGDFTYTEVGLLDKTHIHMFTYNEMIRMFVENAKYVLDSVSITTDNSSLNGTKGEENNRLIDDLLKLGHAERFMYQAYQYLIIARKSE